MNVCHVFVFFFVCLTVGHGQSEGVRVHVDSVDEYVNDVLHHVKIVQQRYPHVPLFAVGHSMVPLIQSNLTRLTFDNEIGIVGEHNGEVIASFASSILSQKTQVGKNAHVNESIIQIVRLPRAFHRF